MAMNCKYETWKPSEFVLTPSTLFAVDADGQEGLVNKFTIPNVF